MDVIVDSNNDMMQSKSTIRQEDGGLPSKICEMVVTNASDADARVMMLRM